MTSRVQEEFHLFFNATPPSDARNGFVDNNHNECKNDEESKRIHVRGSGTNQFGTFEILGSYDIDTGILSCQRIYVTTSDGNVIDNRTDEKEKSTRLPGSSHPRKTIEKTYFTRKRPLASRYGAYDDIYDNGTGRTASGRKRQRAISEPSPKTTLSATLTVKDETNDYQKSPAEPSLRELLLGMKSDKTSSETKLVTTKTKVDEKIADVGKSAPPTTTTIRRPSPTKSPSFKKPKSSPPPSSRTPPLTHSSAYQIKIPRSGNHLEAKWRAAHFIYFQRHVENNESQSLNNAVASATTNYVVYEGEMNHGRNLRDGRGVCLYNNGTLYEGEWKKNKEHGNGTLLTGDRKRIIYSGEWERGKMVSCMVESD